jgi:outer membrane protein assembly factor BamA
MIMFLAAVFLTGAMFLGSDVFQSPGFLCDISGVEHFDSAVVCRMVGSWESHEAPLDFLSAKVGDLNALYSVAGFLDAEIGFTTDPGEASPHLKLAVKEGARYWIKGIEIVTDRPDYDPEQLRSYLQVKTGEPCNTHLTDISARNTRNRGGFKSVDPAIIKGPDPGEVYVRITLSDSSEQHPPD